MTYAETLEYFYTRLPMFQRIGGQAYKKDLANTIALCDALKNPQNKFKSIHIAGTNGKGTSAHAIAAVLQAGGYKTGLHTSPHLKSFTERIRIDGEEIPEQNVVDFVARNQSLIEQITPSFFELTVAMAFDYFAREKVDIAVIEVGLGGRLDSTNVITPEVSLITRIGYDHQELLGDTLVQIAGEKAGIIKPRVPVIIGADQPELRPVFLQTAENNQSPLYWAAQRYEVKGRRQNLYKQWIDVEKRGDRMYEDLATDLMGNYFVANLPGILNVIEVLQQQGFDLDESVVRDGLENIRGLTGLKGRWQVLQEDPLVVCDVGHNEDGMSQLARQIRQTPYQDLHLIYGTTTGREVGNLLKLLPDASNYYFCESKVPRSMSAVEVQQLAAEVGIQGAVIPNVNDALAQAKKVASTEDFIFIVGSTFLIAEIETL